MSATAGLMGRVAGYTHHPGSSRQSNLSVALPCNLGPHQQLGWAACDRALSCATTRRRKSSFGQATPSTVALVAETPNALLSLPLPLVADLLSSNILIRSELLGGRRVVSRLVVLAMGWPLVASCCLRPSI